LPLYEYECTSCKHRFELIQKFSDEPAKVCVRCGAPVHRLLSSPAIQFKGTGWYVTDYAGRSSASPEAKKEAKESKAAEKPAAAETSKPAGPSAETSA
jgi:putative FmdB family regulatory protein